MRKNRSIISDFAIKAMLGLFFCALLFSSACKKDEPKDNSAPETITSVEAFNLTGENRLNSLVKLEWYGTDPDGYVVGYEFSFDQETWYYTESQDSTFLFSITAGSDTLDIDFYIRAIDNDKQADESPAYLKIPLKNTPPEIIFNKDLIPVDTSFNLITLVWEASDADGIETMEQIQLKINNGEWTNISPNRSQGTIVPTTPEQSGEVSSTIHYDLSSTGGNISGLLLNDINDFYIRAIDVAGSISKEDTIPSIYVRKKSNDLLVIGANSASPNSFYSSNLNSAGVGFDFIDFVANDAKNQPKIWSPTLSLLMQQYDQVMMYANDVTFTNAQTNADEIVLEFASSAIEEYVTDGGKIFISSSFPANYDQTSGLYGILPIDSFSSSVGLARLPIDSLVVPIESSFPTLTCSSFISGLDPFYPSSDAIEMYSAQLTKNNGWEGPKNVTVKRAANGNTNFIFMSIELHKLAADQTAVQQFFDKVFNDEFNW